MLPAARVIKQQVGIVDIYKTIIVAAGLTPAQQTEGFDLIQIAKELPPGYNRYILSNNFAHKVTAIRSEKWKLIETKKRRRNIYELYDLEKDPGEEVNQFSTQTGIAQDLLIRKNEMIDALGGDSDRKFSSEELTPEQLEGLRSLGYLD